MLDELRAAFGRSPSRDGLLLLLRRYLALGRPILLRSDLVDLFAELAAEPPASSLVGTPVEHLISTSQEATLSAPWVYLGVRPEIGRWRYLRIHTESLDLEEVSVSSYLEFRERVTDGGLGDQAWPLEVDLEPFSEGFPKLKERRSIGRGGEFMNRHLASRLFADPVRGLDRLFRFLSLHSCRGQQLMINAGIADHEALRRAVREADRHLAGRDPEAGWSEVAESLRVMGFEPGWGSTVGRMRETLQLLQSFLEAPDPGTFEALLDRIPMVFRIAIFSPHGYFGQNRVMGLPDTGGQVVYILDQVRALEREMARRLEEQGVDFEPEIAVVTRLIPENRGTSCDQRLEPIVGTRNARILRVPFRTASGEVVRHWISRFEVWPYLERFALEAEGALLAELGGRPDLVIGNYSDGNLVATLLAQRLKVTQFAIAHALEKSKYLLSALYWQENEPTYHFSCQFTADLVAMNAADCIITSTFQEVAGDDHGVGQYESYQSFTMPGLVRVVGGVDVFDPRFNVVSPGVDPGVYFPFTDGERRLRGLQPEIDELLFGDGLGDARGVLGEPDRPILLSIARMDRVKNLTSLVDWYGRSEGLRRQVNLVVVAGSVDPTSSADAEESAEIARMHELLERHHLDGQVRWVGRHLERPLAGELYRVVADRRGGFVQPALFEAFGLTVIEAMTSGLPTFATRYGGPLEIIEHGVSGFHVDPNHGDRAAELMADFFARSAADPEVWRAISEGAMERVRERYTWELYARKLMTLARVYGFWKYVTGLERTQTALYLQMLYNLVLRRRAGAMEGQPAD